MTDTPDELPEIQLDEVLGEQAEADPATAVPRAAEPEIDIDFGDPAAPTATPPVVPEPPAMLSAPAENVGLDLDLEIDAGLTAAPLRPATTPVSPPEPDVSPVVSPAPRPPPPPAAAPAVAPSASKPKASMLDLDALLSDLELPDTKSSASEELKLEAAEPDDALPSAPAPIVDTTPPPELASAPESEPEQTRDPATDLEPEPEPEPTPADESELVAELSPVDQSLAPQEEDAPLPAVAAIPEMSYLEEPADPEGAVMPPEVPRFEEPADPTAAVMLPEMPHFEAPADPTAAAAPPPEPAILETDASFDAAFGDMGAAPTIPVEEPQADGAPPLPFLEDEPPARSALSPADLPTTAEAIETLKKIAGAGFDPEQTRAALTAALNGLAYDPRALPEPKVMMLGIARLLIASGFATDDLVAAVMATLLEE